ncbi:Hypp5838 [Branchiostoma lanceolatum]|uniref:Hypp5838 protein n=1 Tax=Branchiostoma lanceolatum TaxID=7740 RepID=A0A8J9W475_BRALA|nr:Hypp5838 [Branchiostoma lanceolatum]
MADQARDVAQAGQAAAQPVLEMMAEWGRVYLRISDVWLARGVAIGAFYLANRALTMLAVRRAVERRDPDNPDQPADPQVGLEAEVDSLLVPVIFYSQLGYQYFTSILNGPFLKACLQTELEKVGYKEPIDVSVEWWDLPNLPEGGTGPLMGMMKVQGWLLESPEKMSMLSTAAVDSGIPEDVFSVAGVSTVASGKDVEEEEQKVGPSQAKRARLPQEPPAQAELQEGPLKRRRARLLQHKDSPTAQTLLKAFSCLERGAAMVTKGGYQQGEGVEHLLEGIIELEYSAPERVIGILYEQRWLQLEKTQLDYLICSQLKGNPHSTPYLLIQALQLPDGLSRQQAINHVIDVVRQHGETDPMYKHVAYMNWALGYTIWQTTKQPTQALSACASALMYKSDHLPTLYLTAGCSMDVSVPQAIRQFHHYIHTAPTDHQFVPWAHYYLVTLYGQQDPSVHKDRILYHYNMAQQTNRNSLPVFNPIPIELTDLARKVYEHVMAQTGTSDA